MVAALFQKPLSPQPQPQPRFLTFPCGGFRVVGTRKGQGLQSPPVCAGAGDRSRSQEHGQAADRGLPGLESSHFFLESFAFPFVFTSCGCCNKSPQTSWLKTIETYSLVVLEARDPNHCTELKSVCHRLHTLRRSWEALPPSSASGGSWCPWLWLHHFIAFRVNSFTLREGGE